MVVDSGLSSILDRDVHGDKCIVAVFVRATDNVKVCKDDANTASGRGCFDSIGALVCVRRTNVVPGIVPTPQNAVRPIVSEDVIALLVFGPCIWKDRCAWQ